jgi:hypothetical protein
MARRSIRRRFRNAYQRTRVIVRKVYPRRRGTRSNSFLRKNKTALTIGVLALVGWYFRDKIKAIFTK